MIPRSIRQKLLLYTLVPTVVIYGIASFRIFSELSSETRRNVELHLSAVVRDNADVVDDALNAVAEAARRVVTGIESQGTAEEYERQALLRNLMGESPLAYGAAVAEMNPLGDGGYAAHGSYVFRDSDSVAVRMFAIDSLATEGDRLTKYTVPYETDQSVWVAPYSDARSTGLLMVTYATPYAARNGTRGVTTVDVLLSEIGGLVESSSAQSYESFIVAPTGMLLHHTDSAALGTSIFDRNLALDSVELRRTIEQITSGETGFVELSAWKEEEAQLLFYTPVENTGWAFAARLTLAEAMAPATQMMVQQGGFMLLSLILIIAAIWFGSSRISRPVHELTEVAKKVAEGDMDVSIPRLGSDEIGVLADSIRHMLEQLRQRESDLDSARHRRFGNLVDGLTGQYFYYNQNAKGEYELVSPSVEEILGYDSEQALALKDYLVPDSEINQEIVALSDSDGEDQALFELEMFNSEGEIRRLEVYEERVRDENGVTSGFEGMVCDITDRIAETVKYRSLMEDAEAASKAKSIFLANMSHEIRTPMNAILGFTELLADRVEGKLEKRYLESIDSAGRSLMALINDILDLSRVEAGDISLQYQPVNVEELAESILPLFAEKIAISGISLTVEPKDGGSFGVVLDDARLRQILIHLIGNAVKFTEKGGVRIIIESLPSEIETGHIDLTISVVDSGVGIDEKNLESIFGAFEQLADHGYSDLGGTGLGLAISKRLAEVMNGRIWVESILGEGSAFHVRLQSVRLASEDEVTLLKQQSSTMPSREAIDSPEPTADLALDDGSDDQLIYTDEERANFSELADRLSADTERVAEMSETMTINLIEAFAGEVRTLASEYHHRGAESWAERLAENIELFELDAVTAQLSAFPDLITQIRESAS